MKMANLTVQAPPVNFSNHNLSHSYTSTCEMGKLIPIFWQRVYPNDRIDLKNEVFLRFSPLVYPLLAEVNVKLFSFYCPSIAIWEHWKKFMSEKPLNEEPEKPYFTIGELYENWSNLYQPCSLADYLGLPMQQFFSGAKYPSGEYINDKLSLETIGEPIGIEPFVVYQKIWNRWFRDENLELDIFDEDQNETTDGEDIQYEQNLWHLALNNRGINISGEIICNELFKLRNKAWEKDLFTSALPTPQFGEPVNVPIVGNVQFTPEDISQLYGLIRNYPPTGGKIVSLQNYTITNLGISNGKLQAVATIDGENYDVDLALNDSKNLSVANGNFTINDLRMASAVQRYQESLMRAGHRYEEQMRYQFDQIVPNASLREPELISASTVPVQFNEVSQTSETSDTALGTQAGQAFGYNNGQKTSTKFHCPDHGYIMTIMAVVPRTSYMNGLSKEWQLFHRLDYFNPIFEHVGDEPLYRKEIYLSGNETKDNEEFGYIPRYAREKVGLNKTTGEMTNTLLRMNLSRAFDTSPYLNQTFIHVDEKTTNRGFAILDSNISQHIWFIAKNHVYMRRPMQYNPIPKLL